MDWSRRDEQWCRFFDCGSELPTTRNVEGGALFWRNLDGRGEGRMETVHAGLPARNGRKVGLNIWTDVDLREFGDGEAASLLGP